MNAVKKYCTKAVLIEDGYIKASGDVDKVANQYSLDNLQTEISAGDKPETKETLIQFT